MIKKTIEFENPEQVVQFCEICRGMQSDVDVTEPDKRWNRYDGKSILGLLSIGLDKKLQLEINGADEEQVINRIQEYVID